MYIAALQGHIECLKELIAAGADLNKEDKDGRTPLYSAANQGHVECLKEIIAAGAELNKENKDGLTALYIAANQGHGMFEGAHVLELISTKNVCILVQRTSCMLIDAGAAQQRS